MANGGEDGALGGNRVKRVSNRPEGEKEPAKYWLSTLPEDTPVDILVDTGQIALAHRTRLRGTQKRARPRHFSKGEAGADSIITPPSAPQPTVFSSAKREISRLTSRPTPRGAANPTRTAYRKFDRHDPKTTHGRAGPNPHALPVSPNLAAMTAPWAIVVTQ
jgi:hypothetical protein